MRPANVALVLLLDPVSEVLTTLPLRIHRNIAPTYDSGPVRVVPTPLRSRW